MAFRQIGRVALPLISRPCGLIGVRYFGHGPGKLPVGFYHMNSPKECTRPKLHPVRIADRLIGEDVKMLLEDHLLLRPGQKMRPIESIQTLLPNSIFFLIMGVIAGLVYRRSKRRELFLGEKYDNLSEKEMDEYNMKINLECAEWMDKYFWSQPLKPSYVEYLETYIGAHQDEYMGYDAQKLHDERREAYMDYFKKGALDISGKNFEGMWTEKQQLKKQLHEMTPEKIFVNYHFDEDDDDDDDE